MKFENKITIVQNGNEVIAIDRKTGKKAKAICSKDDEFDFYVGANLAFKRLVDINVGDMVRVVSMHCVGISANEYINEEWFTKYLDHFVKNKYPVSNKTYKVISESVTGKITCIQDLDTTQVFVVIKEGLKKER